MARKVDAIIIGGGIVGCATAYYLARRGLKPVLFEKGVIAGEQSSRNWGFVRQQGRDPIELPLMIEGNRIWRTLEAELEADLGWRQAGNLAIAADETRLAAFERWLPIAKAHGLDSRIVSKSEIEALVPGIAKTWSGGLYTASDGQAEPDLVTAALAAAAVRHGAQIVEGRAVHQIDMAGGKVTGVKTKEMSLKADTVVVAAGAWSARLLRTLGLYYPQALLRASVARIRTVREISAAGVWTPAVAFRQRRDGTLNISSGQIDYDITLDDTRNWRSFYPLLRENRGRASFHAGRPLWRSVVDQLRGTSDGEIFERTPTLDPPVSRQQVTKAMAGLKLVLPGIESASIERSWAGMIDMTPDAVPVIDEVKPGLILAAGFSGHGFGMGPIAGRLVSEWIEDGRPGMNVSGFTLKRFEGNVKARAVI